MPNRHDMEKALELLGETLRENARYRAIDVDTLVRAESNGEYVVFKVEDITHILNMGYSEHED